MMGASVLPICRRSSILPVCRSYFSRVDLDPGARSGLHESVRHRPEQLVATPAELSAHRALVQQRISYSIPSLRH